MAKNQDKEPNVGGLPEISLLLIRAGGGKINVVSLDEYRNDSEIAQMFEEALDKYGERNIRYCKVVGVKVNRTVQFIE